jgi:hypothetical protein
LFVQNKEEKKGRIKEKKKIYKGEKGGRGEKGRRGEKSTKGRDVERTLVLLFFFLVCGVLLSAKEVRGQKILLPPPIPKFSTTHMARL